MARLFIALWQMEKYESNNFTYMHALGRIYRVSS